MTKTKKPVELIVDVVLDRSGSMQSIKADTIGAFNSYVEELAKSNPGSKLSLTLFDTQGIDVVHDYMPVKEVPGLTSETFVPRGGTPLYDAIGATVARLATAKGKAKALVILTDGEENSSREYTADAVKKLLSERQEKDGWLVVYLGANQDAFAVGARLGVGIDNAMNYSTGNIGATMMAASASTARYASAGGGEAGRLRSAFTQGERDKSK